MASNTFFGWLNQFVTGTLSAGAQVSSLPVTNLAVPQGAASMAWQTPPGVVTSAAGAWVLLDSLSSATVWRAFLLARTNLSPAATVRWRVGSADALIEATPTLVFDASTNTLVTPAGWSFTRASVAFSFDATGTLVQSANDTLRIDHDPATWAVKGALFEPASTNLIRNPRCEGAIAGTPGTSPTNWGITNTYTGVTQTIVGTGTINGIPYIDVNWSGTVTGGTSIVVSPENVSTNASIPAVQGQTWTWSFFVQMLSGALPAPAVLQIQILEFNSSNATVATGTAPVYSLATSGGPLSALRYVYTYTTLNAACNWLRARFNLVTLQVGTAYNFTLRIGLPQMEMQPFATSPIMPAVNARVASTRAADVGAITQTVPASWSIYADMTVAQGAAAAIPLAVNPVGGYSATTSTALQTSGTTAQLTVGDGAGGTLWSPSIASYASGVAFKATLGFDTAGSIFAFKTSTSATTGALVLPALGSISLGNSGTPAVVLVRRLAWYVPKLANAQLTALAATGSSLNAGNITYDSGTVPAGVVTGYGQSLLVAPSNVTGRYAQVDINDPGNANGFINVPLAFAGPAWNPFVGPDYASMFGRDDVVAETLTRGGQEYPVLHWQRRRWDVVLQGIQAAEVLPNVMELDRISRTAANILFVLDATNGNANVETVFGRLKATKDIGYLGGGTAIRSWAASVTERL